MFVTENDYTPWIDWERARFKEHGV